MMRHVQLVQYHGAAQRRLLLLLWDM